MCRRRGPATRSAACTTAWRSSRRGCTSTSIWRTTSCSRGPPAWSRSSSRADEPRDGRERLLASVAVREMAAVIEEDGFDRALDARRHGFDLAEGSVLVLLALNHQDGAGDGGEELFDGPGGELGPQPDLRPGVEDPVGVVAVEALQLSPKVSILETVQQDRDAG